jgi:hypothetical protein
MKETVLMLMATLVMAPDLLLAQTSVDTPLAACQKQNEQRAAEITQLRTEVERLKQTIVGLSTRLTGSSPEIPTPNPEVATAKLLVLIKTKYGRGQSCAITANGEAIGKIEYPDLKGPDRVMDYSSGFIRLKPGDYRITMTCTPTRSENIHSVDKDVSLEGGRSYALNTKINVWTKRLQLEGFVQD